MKSLSLKTLVFSFVSLSLALLYATENVQTQPNKQVRVYVDIVGDLFHAGHIQFRHAGDHGAQSAAEALGRSESISHALQITERYGYGNRLTRRSGQPKPPIAPLGPAYVAAGGDRRIMFEPVIREKRRHPTDFWPEHDTRKVEGKIM